MDGHARQNHNAAQTGERGLERLRVCALLFEQAADKRSHGELMESLELRAEARALRREAYAMLSGDAARGGGETKNLRQGSNEIEQGKAGGSPRAARAPGRVI